MLHDDTHQKIRILELAISRNNESVSSLTLLAECYLQSSNLWCAITAYDLILKKQPTIENVCLIIKHLFSLRECKLCRKYIKFAHDNKLTSLDFIARLGDVEFILGNYKDAVDAYKKVAGISPEILYPGYYWQALIYNNEVQHAIDLINIALEKNPNIAEAYHCLSKAYLKNGEYKIALKNIHKAISIAPENEAYHTSYRELCIQAKHKDMALENIIKILNAKKEPENSFYNNISSNTTLHHVKLEGRNIIGENTSLLGFIAGIHVGYATTIGKYNDWSGDISIGRYSQTGPNVAIRASDHPKDRLSTYVGTLLLNGHAGTNSADEERSIRIGHDVWIGNYVTILRGVNIGNGAIIGAGSVIAKNIPDYAIAVGNPAKVVKMRFDDEIIALLNQLAWWELDSKQLIYFVELHQLFQSSLNSNRDTAIEHIKLCIALKNSYNLSLSKII